MQLRMSHAEEVEFVDRRSDVSLNYSGKEKKDRINAAMANLLYTPDPTYPELVWVDDGGHGYLIVTTGNRFYEQAKKFESESYSRPYRTMSGNVLLEEDEDAQLFLKSIKSQ